jgi:hypothetical protein
MLGLVSQVVLSPSGFQSRVSQKQALHRCTTFLQPEQPFLIRLSGASLFALSLSLSLSLYLEFAPPFILMTPSVSCIRNSAMSWLYSDRFFCNYYPHKSRACSRAYYLRSSQRVELSNSSLN